MVTQVQEKEKAPRAPKEKEKQVKSADDYAIEYLTELKQRTANLELLWMRVKNDEEAVLHLQDRVDQAAAQLAQLKYLLKRGNLAPPQQLNNIRTIQEAEEEIKRRTHSDQKSSVQQQAQQTTTQPF